MSEIFIAVRPENVAETQNLFKGIAEKYKDPNNQQDTLTGFSSEIREKLKIKGPNYVPGYNFSQAIIEQSLRKEWIDRRPGGLKKTSEDFLEFIEKMGINPQDPSVPLKKLTEEYLLRPYVTKVHPAKSAPAAEATEVVVNPNLVQAPPEKAMPTTQPTPETEEAAIGPEAPEKRTSRIRRMLAGLNEFLAQPGEEATALRERLATADRQTFETLKQAVGSLAGKVPDLFRRKPEEAAEVGVEAAETPAQREGRIRGILRGINEFLMQPSDEAARLREADQKACEDLARSLRSLARKVPDLFRRTPQAVAETQAAGEEALE